MEMGADAVLVNTAIAVANDPNRMAIAFRMAVEAGRPPTKSASARNGNRQRHQPVDRIFEIERHETKQLCLPARVRQILAAAQKARALVIGDVMLDHFIWGQVGRISPEAPVPVVEFERESFIPGGAANVARNLTALNLPTELFGVVGRDAAAAQLKRLLQEHEIGCDG